MDNINDLYELCDFLDRDLKTMNEKIRNMGGKMNNETLGYVDRLTHAIKSLKTVIAMEEEHNGYSQRGMSYARGDRTGRVHWNDGSVSYGDNSYERGRGSNANRDSRGRYSSAGYEGYSRDDAKADMMHELHELMNDADPAMRGKFQTFISKLERM